jgi:hypothetical protein
VILALAVGCGPPSTIKLSAASKFEVGEDAVITIEAPGVSTLDALLVLERPDGTKVRESASISSSQTRVKFTKPTFTTTGKYTVVLVGDGRQLATPLEINVTIDRLTELLAETIAEHKATARYTRVRKHGDLEWKQYGGIYRHPELAAEVEVIIEEPGDAFKPAWFQYAGEGTLEVIEKNYVRLKQRTNTTTARWISRGRILTLRAKSLQTLDPKFVIRFFARHPSDLKATAAEDS